MGKGPGIRLTKKRRRPVEFIGTLTIPKVCSGRVMLTRGMGGSERKTSERKMKRILLSLTTIFLVANCSALGQTTNSKNDQLLIEHAIDNWNEAWQTKDSKLAAQDYSDDADWTNAFGMKRRGRAEIEKVLAEVFALPFVIAGQSSTVEQSVRFIKPDVALVVTRVERLGQRVASGAELGTGRRATYECS